jgi:hypothetical protein
MSWASEFFGGGGGPEPGAPTAADWARAEQMRQEQIAAAQAQRAEQERARFSGAQDTARSSARDYFTQRGLNPDDYSAAIDRRLAELSDTINPSDEHPGSYLTGLGSDVYGAQTDIARQRAMQGLEGIFSPDYGYSRIGSGTDDPFLAQINSAERSRADTFLENLLKRGVINQTGFEAGRSNLDLQGSRARSLLDTLGGDVLEEGRAGLESIANRGRQAASNVQLGQSFDPSKYGTEANTAFDEFLSKLPDRLRASAPTNLYDTSGLASIAGAAQGAGNFAFDPNALAGIMQSDEEERRKRQQEESSGRTSRPVF